jgi:Cation transporter/ATPase, N-terminus
MVEAPDLALAGLTSQEAAQRPATDGPNELPAAN